MAATGTPGDDRPDLVVGLSAPCELDDLAHLQDACVPNETCFVEAVLNYLSEPSATDILDHNYTPFLADLHAASPTTYVTQDMPPLFIMCSSNDTGGVDTFQFPDLIAKLDSVGLTETKSGVPTAGQYKENIIPAPPPPAAGTHAFAYWGFPVDGVVGHTTVATTVINWLQAGPPGSEAADLLNVSARLQVGAGDRVGISGFIVEGTETKRVMLRAIGPSLAQKSVPGSLSDPSLELHDSTGAIIGRNDNWQTTQIGGVITGNQVAAIQASTIAPTNAAESALIASLAPGAYTAVIQGGNGGTGVGLAEVYDLDSTATATVVNLSTRAFVQTGANQLIGGFIVGGLKSSNVVVRALGPSLLALDVPDALVDPVLELRDADGTLVASNDNWADTQGAELEASGLAPTNPLEAAIERTLAPGSYTAIVAGKNGTIGVGLVEVYKLP